MMQMKVSRMRDKQTKKRRVIGNEGMINGIG